MKGKCRVCNSSSIVNLFNANVLGNNAIYYECQDCLYIQVGNPNWLDQAYKKPINATDTGILVRNLHNQRVVFSAMLCLGRPRSKVLDWGGGYGILVRLLRDIGIDAYWTDPYCKNLFASGFEYDQKIVGMVTSFETLEHIVNPLKEVKKMLLCSSSLLISTEVASCPAPKIYDWDYYGIEHGQHIGFFRPSTICIIAELLGKQAIRLSKNIFLICNNNINPKTFLVFYKIAMKIPLHKYILKSKTYADYSWIKSELLK